MSILNLTPAAEKQIDLLSEENECYGITLNIKSLVGANFEIRNPNAHSSCGCGVSVNFDMDNLVPQF
jgi:hypothetical protein